MLNELSCVVISKHSELSFCLIPLTFTKSLSLVPNVRRLPDLKAAAKSERHLFAYGESDGTTAFFPLDRTSSSISDLP